jgi:hypothetical protein
MAAVRRKAAVLRPITSGEAALVGAFAVRHGAVRGFVQSVSDNDGAISAPLIRLSLLARLEARGTISQADAAAGERFHWLFQTASLDGLKAADMSRIPAAAGAAAGDLPPSAERCRIAVSQAMTVLGGAGSPAASAVWHVCGLGWSTRQWAIISRRRHELAAGILIGALAALQAHFAGRAGRPRR